MHIDGNAWENSPEPIGEFQPLPRFLHSLSNCETVAEAVKQFTIVIWFFIVRHNISCQPAEQRKLRYFSAKTFHTTFSTKHFYDAGSSYLVLSSTSCWQSQSPGLQLQQCYASCNSQTRNIGVYNQWLIWNKRSVFGLTDLAPRLLLLPRCCCCMVPLQDSGSAELLSGVLQRSNWCVPTSPPPHCSTPASYCEFAAKLHYSETSLAGLLYLHKWRRSTL